MLEGDDDCHSFHGILFGIFPMMMFWYCSVVEVPMLCYDGDWPYLLISVIHSAIQWLFPLPCSVLFYLLLLLLFTDEIVVVVDAIHHLFLFIVPRCGVLILMVMPICYSWALIILVIDKLMTYIDQLLLLIHCSLWATFVGICPGAFHRLFFVDDALPAGLILRWSHWVVFHIADVIHWYDDTVFHCYYLYWCGIGIGSIHGYPVWWLIFWYWYDYSRPLIHWWLTVHWLTVFTVFVSDALMLVWWCSYRPCWHSGCISCKSLFSVEAVACLSEPAVSICWALPHCYSVSVCCLEYLEPFCLPYVDVPDGLRWFVHWAIVRWRCSVPSLLPFHSVLFRYRCSLFPVLIWNVCSYAISHSLPIVLLPIHSTLDCCVVGDRSVVTVFVYYGILHSGPAVFLHYYLHPTLIPHSTDCCSSLFYAWVHFWWLMPFVPFTTTGVFPVIGIVDAVFWWVHSRLPICCSGDSLLFYHLLMEVFPLQYHSTIIDVLAVIHIVFYLPFFTILVVVYISGGDPGIRWHLLFVVDDRWATTAQQPQPQQRATAQLQQLPACGSPGPSQRWRWLAFSPGATLAGSRPALAGWQLAQLAAGESAEWALGALWIPGGGGRWALPPVLFCLPTFPFGGCCLQIIHSVYLFRAFPSLT